MAFRPFHFILWLLCVAKQIAAGFVPPAAWCLPTSGLKELSGCIAMTNKEEECAAKGSEEDKIACFCTQEMLSSYYDCKSDVYRCVATHMFDSQFDSKVHDWHRICDSHISITPTTPSVPTMTTTWDKNICNSLYQSCVSADYETNKCSETYMPSEPVSYVSCACQRPIYSLFSECQYNGNVSCMWTSAAESNILGYSVCPYFWPGTSTLPPMNITSAILSEWPSTFLRPTLSPHPKFSSPVSPTTMATSVIKPASHATAKLPIPTARKKPDLSALVRNDPELLALLENILELRR